MARGNALHIGLDRVDPKHYQGWDGALVACEADAHAMADVAKACGYASTVLLTRRATRTAVLRAIGRAAGALGAGDIFLVTYSGHGGQLPDRNGDEPDLEDETWCLYDGELVDDELHEAWAGFAAGVRVVVLSDSCHSGSVTRALYRALAPAADATARFRAMPTVVAMRTYHAHRAFYDDIGRRADPAARARIAATVLLISGCHDNQLSTDGDFNGLFTGRLLQVWNGSDFPGSYRDFHRAIVKKMPPTQVPELSVIGAANPAFEAQRPFTIAVPAGAAPAPPHGHPAKKPARRRRAAGG